MISFRTELENPIVENDIIDLERKIQLFNEGKIDGEKFRSLRLARGIYGQRQTGVQMIRIKLPFGKITSKQMHRIADVSDEYSRGRLHITTRQDIQIHHVSLDRTPELWSELERDEITIREACGNTVRNITASETAGIDPKEAFDVSPYADALFKFFLRNPVGQELGRKIKLAFSGSPEDTALTFIHDVGFIAKTKTVDGKIIKGFKIVIAGGLGSQPRATDLAFEFMETDQIIPFTESVLRVFDRYGERTNRNKARLKFLLKDLGLDAFLELIKAERKALSYTSFPIDEEVYDSSFTLPTEDAPEVFIENKWDYQQWLQSNVFEQKQEGLFAIGIKVLLGDFYTDKARELADLVKEYAAGEMRLTLRQDILIKHVKADSLPYFYSRLKQLGFAEIGYNSTQDITACPGTDTCNLGIASSTGIARELENVLKTEYPEYANNKEITIKISGCMNACGQHNIAQIGFQGMTIKAGDLLAPALQVLLGGGVLGDGLGRFSDKVIKIPSKRGPTALRILLDDYGTNADEDESFNAYYERQGEKYFYEALKPLTDLTNLTQDDFIDWGHKANYIKAIGVGECAGVVIDLVATLLFESEEKIQNSKGALADEKWSDSIYHSYSSFVNTAKAILLSEGFKTNSQATIIQQFEENFISNGTLQLDTTFTEMIYQIQENEPTENFAKTYLNQAVDFYEKIDAYRLQKVSK